MKNILLYTMTLNYGVAEKNICALANYLSEFYNVILVSNIKSKKAFKLKYNIKVYQFDNFDSGYKKLKAKISKKRTKQLKSIILNEQVNTVIAFLPEPSIRALQLKKELNIKVIVSVRNNPKYEFKYCKFMRNYYYKMADKIVVQDETYKKFLPCNEKCIVVPNFLEKINISPNLKKENYIINVGRLEKNKNQKLLIKAYSLISTDLKLYIYGEGSLKNKLLKLIKKLNLEGKVIIKPYDSNIYEKIAKAKLFVLSSLYEGMPNVVLESLALRTKVVSTNNSPMIANLLPKEFISQFNTYNLAKCIETALKSDKIVQFNYNNDDSKIMWKKIVEDDNDDE